MNLPPAPARRSDGLVLHGQIDGVLSISPGRTGQMLEVITDEVAENLTGDATAPFR